MIPLAAPGNDPPLLVGRSREQRLLRAQLGTTFAGRGSLVMLSGDEGIGKTTLAEDICREASTAGALVLSGRCYDRTETPPYGPWRDILAQYDTFLQSFPSVRTFARPSLTHSTSQVALFSEMLRFLVESAREQPLVIVLDDAHWADTASLDLLRFVARQLASVPILLLVAYRSDEVTREHPLYGLVPMLVREAGAVRIDVSPLDEDDVSVLIDLAYRLPTADARQLARYLQERAEGNPFFLNELLRSLEGTVLLQTSSGVWDMGAFDNVRVPTLLRQVIDARLARLGETVEHQLTVAAVIGQIVPLTLWAAVTETTEEMLLPLVERAVAAHVFDASPNGLAVRFTHALIREALFDSVLPPRRRIWHQRIGEALLAQNTEPDPDAVAYHLNLAGDRRAVDWLTRAGQRAQRAFAWGTATKRYETALALVEDDDDALNERGWLLFRLALLCRFAVPSDGAAYLEEAERLGQVTGDRALEACARFHQGMLRCQGADFQRGIAAEEAGIAMLDALTPTDRLRLAAIDTTSDPLDAQSGRGELTLALAENWQLARARTLGEHIISLPPEQTSGSRGDAYYGLGFVYSGLGQPDEARSAFARAREIFVANDYRSMVTASLFDELMVVILTYSIDQPHERQRLETELGESLAALDDVFDRRSVRGAEIVTRVLEGAWADAFAMFEQGSIRFMRLATAALLAPLARHQGNASLAWSLILEGLPAGPETAPEDTGGKILSLRTLAVTLALDEGNLDVASQWLESLDRWLEWSGSVFGRADAHLCWAAYHRATGDTVRARARAVSALAAAGAPRQPLTLLAAHRLLGELDLAAGRLADAETQLAAALALADACGSRHEQALTLLVQADVLRGRGDIPAAREHLDTVRAICTPMGATVALAQADLLEAHLTVASVSTPTTMPAGLTVREAEVLRLLATGLPNAEIARQLSLSIRTVNAHLTNIYGKLGVTTRGAAIRFALDHDIR